jgi:gliding motility-associated-like protein
MSKYLLIFLILNASLVHAQVPVAEFSADKTSGCGSLVVQFTDQSTNSPSSWSWNFGNGATSTLQNPVIAYGVTGTFTVTLIATNASGSNTITKTALINVFGLPNTDFSADKLSGCAPLEIKFTDISTAGNSPSAAINFWEWDFGDGSPLNNIQNPTHTYNSSGQYSVTLEVRDGNTCSKKITKSAYINANPKPSASFSASQLSGCDAPFSVTFTNTSTGASTYQWYFGDGNTGTGQSPSHTYNAPGTYSVTMVAASAEGCTDSVVYINYINVGSFIADFSASNFNPCAGDTVWFTNQSLGAIAFNWDFGDPTSGASNTSSQENPFHIFQSEGTYQVYFQASTSGGCSGDTIMTIVVNPLPQFDFTADQNILCELPALVNFTANLASAQSYQWNFGDGNTGTGISSSNSYTAFGNYNVSLTVSDTNGCSASLSKAQFIKIGPLLAFFIVDTIEGCAPLLVNFTDQSTSLNSINQWAWDFGDGGSSTAQNPAYTFTNTGIFTVTLAVTDTGGCTGTYSSQISVGSTPLTDFTADKQIVCHGDTVFFTDLSSAFADFWQWDFGGNGSSLLQDPYHIFTDTGYFDIQLISKFNGCPDTLVIDSFVYVLPPKPLFNATPLIGCEFPLDVQFTDQSQLPETWLWDFGDGNTSTDPNPLHTYQNPGFYTVKLVVTNDDFGLSCIDSLEQQQLISISDIIPGFDQDTIKICQNQTIQFTDTSYTNTSIVTYFWDFGDGNTLVNIAPQTGDSFVLPSTNGGLTTGTYKNPIHNFAIDGTYDVKLVLTDALGCQDSVTMNQLVTVRKLPEVGFTANFLTGCAPLEVNFSDTSIVYSPATLSGWNWNFGNGITDNTGNNSPTVTYAQRGNYNVSLTVTDTEGCSNTVSYPNYIVPTFPYPDFSTSASTNTSLVHCHYHTVDFTNASSGTGLSYLWDFGDGTTSISETYSHFYTNVNNTQTFNVSLTVTDVNGCDSILSKIITISRPIAEYAAVQSSTDCPPFPAQFNDLSTADVTSWWWNFGNPSSGSNNTTTLQNPPHYYSNAGYYTVTLAVQNNYGCRDTIIKPDYIHVGGPYGTFTYSPFSGCPPLNVNFTAADTFNVNVFQWVFGDGFSDTVSGVSVSHSYEGGTWLPVLVLKDNNGCSVSLIGSQSINVTNAVPDFSVSATDLCSIGPVTFTDSSTASGSISSWSWDFGDGGTGVQQNPVHNYTSPGTYGVSLEITVNGCSFSVTKPDLINIFSAPVLEIISSIEPKCGFSAVDFDVNDSASAYTALTWSWSFGDGNTSSDKVTSNNYLQEGFFNVSVTAGFKNGNIVCPVTYTDIVEIIIPPLVTADFTSNVNAEYSSVPVVFIDQSSSYAVDWQWYFADGDTAAGKVTSHSFGLPGTYDVMLIAYSELGCPDTAIKQILILEGIFVPNVFSPNGDGVNDFFYVKNTDVENLKIEIFNRWGTKIWGSEGRNSRWDGRSYAGDPVPEGTYYFIIEAITSYKDLSTKGTVTLVR